MKLLKIPFWIIWRVWFYILVLVPIVILFPFLFISLLKETWYPYFFKLARIWAKVILYGMGFYPKVETEQEVIPGKSYMFIANHTSMTDIMLMLAVVKNPCVFVGKKELVKIPLFGFFFKRSSGVKIFAGFFIPQIYSRFKNSVATICSMFKRKCT